MVKQYGEMLPSDLAQNKLSANGNFISAVQEPRNIVCANTARQAQLAKQPGAGRRAIKPARERTNHGAAAVTVS